MPDKSNNIPIINTRPPKIIPKKLTAKAVRFGSFFGNSSPFSSFPSGGGGGSASFVRRRFFMASDSSLPSIPSVPAPPEVPEASTDPLSDSVLVVLEVVAEELLLGAFVMGD